ncbi:hypothetical protein H4R19_001000 [Coemansia spiralis]|nr:hypothetical protein H4R19_001000 [Coemansia spiralis]
MANQIAECAAANLEALIDPPADGTEVAFQVPAGDYRWPRSAAMSPDFELIEPKIRSAFGTLRPLVVETADSPADADWKEKNMYGWIEALTLFVAHHVDCGLREPSYRGQARKVLPYAVPDRNPQYSDDFARPDQGLALRSIEYEVHHVTGEVDYSDVFALVEAKGERAAPDGGSESPLNSVTEKAFVQLLNYTRQAYSKQVFRRFAWGLTQCCAEARACVLVSSGIVATHAMDLHGVVGRRELVQLLVDWSLCEYHQLGLDPSIRWIEDLNCWEIDVPRSTGMDSTSSATIDGDATDGSATGGDSTDGNATDGNATGGDAMDVDATGGNTAGDDTTGSLAAGGDATGGDTTKSKTVKYYFRDSLMRADHLLGRHTRCFAATSKRPKEEETDPSHFVPEVVIKDAWAYVESTGKMVGELGEVKFHEIIREKIPVEMREHLPRIRDGGAVEMATNGVDAADTTDEVLGAALNTKLPAGPDNFHYHYAHMRMAITPIAEPLRNVRSVYELIIIFNDVVKAIGALHDIGILHRDISLNNVMFVRSPDGRVHGVLLDMDNALSMEHAEFDGMRICTGTRPFMSVNNLEAASVRRSRVDDLESVLYGLIWVGVWGATVEHREKTTDMLPKVAKWSDPSEAAEQKRSLMNNAHSLDTITTEFYTAKRLLPEPRTSEDAKTAKSINDSYKLLKQLVRKLRGDLFDNPNVSCYARGTHISDSDLFACEGKVCKCPGIGGKPDEIDGKVDPFRERTKEDVGREVYNKFAATTEEYATKSRRVIYPSDASKEATGMPEGSSKAGGSAPVDDTGPDDGVPPPQPVVG